MGPGLTIPHMRVKIIFKQCYLSHFPTNLKKKRVKKSETITGRERSSRQDGELWRAASRLDVLFPLLSFLLQHSAHSNITVTTWWLCVSLCAISISNEAIAFTPIIVPIYSLIYVLPWSFRCGGNTNINAQKALLVPNLETDLAAGGFSKGRLVYFCESTDSNCFSSWN